MEPREGHVTQAFMHQCASRRAFNSPIRSYPISVHLSQLGFFKDKQVEGRRNSLRLNALLRQLLRWHLWRNLLEGSAPGCHFEVKRAHRQRKSRHSHTFAYEYILDGPVDYYREKQAQHSTLIPATTLPCLGLVDKSYNTENTSVQTLSHTKDEKPWQRFRRHVESLNVQDPRIIYKVLYITRHGYGHHNAFMAQVSRHAWNNHWSHMDGDGQITWADSHLNDEGIEQAKSLGEFWSDAVGTDMIPLPGTIYTSPLARTLETTRLAFTKVTAAHGAPFQPIVKELLRERLTNHTCDRRRSLSWIKEHYPDYIVEPGFSDDDMLWSSSREETEEEHVARKQQLLQDVFENDRNDFVALTTHSYAISALLQAVNMPVFRVREGSSVALLVRAERFGGAA